MDEHIRKAALDYHRLPRPGKLAIEATKRMATQRDLALAYSPGVAAPCLAIAENPDLVDSAVEEVLRWTSIVIQFGRTCTQDTEIRGQKIRAGQTVGMWYPSANRDEDVFDRLYSFDITRDPNPHYAFGGYGEHFCLGANLARWELRTMFRELIPVMQNMELAGEPEFVAQSLHVGGIKRLPVSWTPA